MANRIKHFRNKAGLTRDAMAEAVNASSAQIYRLETGGRALSDEWMRRLAKPLGCTPSDFLPDEDFDPRLSVDEKTLLAKYRRLNADNRARSLTVIDAVNTALTEAESTSPPKRIVPNS